MRELNRIRGCNVAEESESKQQPRYSESAEYEPLASLALSDQLTNAILIAGDIGQPVQTGQLLDAIMQTSATADWHRIIVRSGGGIDPTRLKTSTDPQASDSRFHGRHGDVRLSDTVTRAFELVSYFDLAYDLSPVTAGITTLALVADPNNSASLALFSGVPSDSEHCQLLDAVQMDLLGFTIKNFHKRVLAHEAPTELLDANWVHSKHRSILNLGDVESRWGPDAATVAVTLDSLSQLTADNDIKQSLSLRAATILAHCNGMQGEDLASVFADIGATIERQSNREDFIHPWPIWCLELYAALSTPSPPDEEVLNASIDYATKLLTKYPDGAIRIIKLLRLILTRALGPGEISKRYMGGALAIVRAVKLLPLMVFALFGVSVILLFYAISIAGGDYLYLLFIVGVGILAFGLIAINLEKGRRRTAAQYTNILLKPSRQEFSKQSLEVVGRAIGSNPAARRGALLIQSQICRLNQQPDNAASDLDELLRCTPDDTAIRCEVALVRIAAGDHSAAIRELSQVISLEPRRSSAYRIRGQVHALNKKHHQAIADFNRCLQINPLDRDAYFARASSYTALGANAEASADANQAGRLL